MGRSRIRLLAAGVAGFVVLVAVATHFLLPPYIEGRVEERLEERGGVAHVDLRAVPALRLLAGHGDRIAISGSGLDVDVDKLDTDAFERLGNFDEVDIDLANVTAGPVEADSFRLVRTGSGDRYTIEVDAAASVEELARLAGEQFGPLGGLVGAVVGDGVPFSSVPVPMRLDGELEVRDGEVEMLSGSGRVAGIPAGPAALLVTNAVLSGL